MPRAVRFDHYGPVDVLQVVDVSRPEPAAGEIVVEVVSSGINPGEIAIRSGALHEVWPATFPSGQGSDLAGRVVAVGSGVTRWAVGDEVLGFSEKRSAQADYVAIPAEQATPKPAALDWDQAGALYVVGTTAYAAVRAVDLHDDDTVVVSGAAGGVGSLAVQLARRTGARVIGIASGGNAAWLQQLGVEPVEYGDGLADRLRQLAPDGIDALVDTYGGGYVELAINLGVPPDRIDTIIDRPAAAQYGTKTDGNAAANNVDVLAELADLIVAGDLVLPIAASYPLEQVQAAYTELAERHTRGKIVLRLR
jgi:NADPH:quinone reductase